MSSKPYTDDDLADVRDWPGGSALDNERRGWLATLDAERAKREEAEQLSSTRYELWKMAVSETQMAASGRDKAEAEAEAAEADNARLRGVLAECRQMARTYDANMNVKPPHQAPVACEMVALTIDAALAETDTEGAGRESAGPLLDAPACRPREGVSGSTPRGSVPAPSPPTPAACRAEREQRSCPTCRSTFGPDVRRFVSGPDSEGFYTYEGGDGGRWRSDMGPCPDPFHTPPAEAEPVCDCAPPVPGKDGECLCGLPMREAAEAAPRQEAQERCWCGRDVLRDAYGHPESRFCCRHGREAAQEGGEDDPYDYIEQLQQEADEVNVLLAGHCFHHEGRMAAIKGLQARAAQGRKMPTVEEVGDVIGRCVFCTWDPLEGTASAARAVLRLLGEGDEPGQEPGGV